MVHICEPGFRSLRLECGLALVVEEFSALREVEFVVLVSDTQEGFIPFRRMNGVPWGYLDDQQVVCLPVLSNALVAR